MTDQVYQNVQYPLKKVVRILTDLENLKSLPPEYLVPENRDSVKRKIEEFIVFWEEEGRPSIKNLIAQLREQQ